MAQLSSAIAKARQTVSGPIARSAISGMVLRLTGMALLFAQAVIAARMLGAESYGVVSILLALAHVGAAVVLFGFGNFAVAEIPRRLHEGMPRVVQLFMRHALARIAALCLLILPITAVAILVVLEDLPPLAIGLAVATVPLLALLQLLRGVALGLERPIGAQLPSEIIRPTLFLTALITAWLIYEVNSLTFLTFYVGTGVVAVLIALLSIRPGVQSPGSPSHGDGQQDMTAEWDRAALPFLGMHLATILQVELATILLGVFASPEAAGLFQPVARISVVLLLPAYALNLRFNPKIAALHANGQTDDIIRLSRKYTWSSVLVLCAAGLAIGLVSPWLLLLFGPEFVDGVLLVWLIVIGRIAFTLFGPATQLLSMTGYTGKALSATALSLVAEILIAMALIPKFGLEGAALAIAAGLLVRGILLTRASKLTLKIGLREFWIEPRSPTKSL